MTTAKPTATTTQAPDGFRFPDPPEREPDEMTSFNHLTITGNAHYLLEHFGNRDTTLVAGEHYVSPGPVRSTAGLHYPDLLISFGVDPGAYYSRNGYIVSEQGKPPDFVMEIASRATGQIDMREKRQHYAELGIPEYWRFDETGEFHGTRLAGDRLVNGQYQPMVIEELPNGGLQGYSTVLNLHLRWDNKHLVWHDPATGQRIVTLEDERQARLNEQARADSEQQARLQEQQTRVAAEARIRELEEQLRNRSS